MSIRLRRRGHLRRVGLGTVTMMLVAACAPAPKTAEHTVEEYRADAALRTRVLKDCANDPGALGNAPDCVNAQQAEAIAGTGSMRELPSLGLAPPDATKPETPSD